MRRVCLARAARHANATSTPVTYRARTPRPIKRIHGAPALLPPPSLVFTSAAPGPIAALIATPPPPKRPVRVSGYFRGPASNLAKPRRRELAHGQLQRQHEQRKRQKRQQHTMADHNIVSDQTTHKQRCQHRCSNTDAGQDQVSKRKAHHDVRSVESRNFASTQARSDASSSGLRSPSSINCCRSG